MKEKGAGMDFHGPIIAAVMIVLDVVVSFAGSVKQKDVQSSKLRDGLWHKAGFVGLIALAYAIFSYLHICSFL